MPAGEKRKALIMDCWRALGSPLDVRRLHRASVMCEAQGCRRPAEFLFTLPGAPSRAAGMCAAYCSAHVTARTGPKHALTVPQASAATC